jgi:pimeloyl-ACP methyl ester carboxylesterase
MAGLDTSYEEGIMRALTAAGVGPNTDVMLVGHSEGGIVAINVARDAVRSARFRVTHVVTAGAPIGKVSEQLPRSVQVLALENDDDVVPATDSADNPERPNITTVHTADEHDSIGGNHSLDETYLPEAQAADVSDNASIDAFLAGAGKFLTGVTARTHAYQITRGF